MVLFIFCFIVITYLLPSVFTLPLTLFIYNVKTKIDALKWLVTMSLVHPVSSVCQKISSSSCLCRVSFFYQIYALNWDWIKAAQLSENAL